MDNYQNTIYLTDLSFILFTFVLVGGFTILLLLALLLALVPVAAPLPPEPEPRALLPPRLPPGRLLPPRRAPRLRQTGRRQQRQQHHAEVLLGINRGVNQPSRSFTVPRDLLKVPIRTFTIKNL